MQHLNESQRYTIYRMRKDKKQAEIARYIGMPQATVSKGLSRNANTRRRYSPKMAQMFADMMKERSRRPYKFNDKMKALISKKDFIINIIERKTRFLIMESLEEAKWYKNIILTDKRFAGKNNLKNFNLVIVQEADLAKINADTLHNYIDNQDK